MSFLSSEAANHRRIPPMISWFLIIFGFLLAPAVWAVRPISQFQDLVAGRGERGFKDGSFTEVLFNNPVGLALEQDKHLLFLADQGNHRIRAVHLEERNRVDTLAGTGKAGNLDGDFSKASFNQPTLLTQVADGNLVVYDAGTSLLRLIDFKKHTVSTLTVKDPKTFDLSGIWAMAYNPPNNCLYFTQPKILGRLVKLNLSNLTATILIAHENPKVPNPAALCLDSKNLYVADWDLQMVYRLPLTEAAEKEVINSLAEMGLGNQVNALAACGDSIYALQAAPPYLICLKPQRPVEMASIWGDSIQTAAENFPNLFPAAAHEQLGFIAGPGDSKRFYVTGPSYHEILTFWDYEYDKYKVTQSYTPDKFNDLNYPSVKPPHTFRILLLGDSHLYHQSANDYKRWPDLGLNRMESLAKRMEVSLNTEAALSESQNSFQVLCMAFPYDEEHNPLLWPYYYVPPMAQKYDVDFVLLIRTSHQENYSSCFKSAPTEEGIPSYPLDIEYLLKPLEERIPPGPAADYFKYLSSKKIIQIDPATGKSIFAVFSTALEDEGCVKRMIDLMGKPLGLLNKKITSLPGKTKKRFELCYIPAGDMHPKFDTEAFRTFWLGLCKQWGIPFMDLTDPFIALRRTYFPVMDYQDNDHYSAAGHQFLAALLIHQMKQEGIVSFK